MKKRKKDNNVTYARDRDDFNFKPSSQTDVTQCHAI